MIMLKIKRNKEVSIFKKIVQYLKASRVDGWYISIIFFILGEWYAISNFPIFYTIIGLICLIGFMTTGFWINYIFDKDVDIKAGKDLSFFKYISTREMFFASIFVFLICSIILLIFVNILSFLLGFSIFVLGFLYSAPPIRLKTRPPFDVFANGLGGSFAFLLGWSVSDISLNFTAFIGSIVIGLAVGSHYFFYTSFDIETDNECNVKTSCTMLGFDNSLSIGIVIFFIAFLFSFFYLDFTVLSISFLINIPLIVSLKIVKNKNIVLFLVGGIFLLWSFSVSMILTIYSYSIITMFISFVSFLFLLYFLISIRYYFSNSLV